MSISAGFKGVPGPRGPDATVLRMRRKRRYHTTPDFRARVQGGNCRDSTAVVEAGHSVQAQPLAAVKRSVSSASTPARRTPGSASSTGGRATCVTLQAARSAPAATEFPPRLRQIFEGVLELDARVRAARSRDRTRVHAPQRRQRAQARAGARRGASARSSRPARRCSNTRRARSSLPSSGRAGRRKEQVQADGVDVAETAGGARSRTPPMRSASRCAMRIRADAARDCGSPKILDRRP